ncbi:DHA2 family efflux MFS transporter permease subunit [Nakamurella silvestris]|nr:DHA2 family efflux MFS transporter permease subunit [Nakamurella silvestris]
METQVAGRSARTGTGAATTPSPDTPDPRRWWILGVAAIAQLIVVLDATIVNIAMPTAQASLGFSNDNRQWLVTGYALAFGSLLLVGGRLADMFGRRLMFVIGLIGFAAASALGGAAGSFGVLLTARGLQGVFGALIAPAALSLLTVTFTQAKERARAFAIFGAVAGSGGAVGLILGGALTEYTSWRWCLFVNVPLAAIAVVGALLLLKKKEQPQEAKPKLDLLGSAVIVAGLVSLVYGLAAAETKGWSSMVTLGFTALGLALIAVFVKVQATIEHPLLPLRVLKDRTRAGSYIAIAIVGAGMFAVFLFLTYYLSTALEFTPLQTGFAFLPMIGGLMVSVQIVPSIVGRIGAKVPVTIGMLVAAAGMLLLTNLDLQSTYAAHIMPGLIVVGLGLGAVMGTAFGAATQGVDADDAGVASAVVNTVQQIGGSIGTAVLSAVSASAATNYLVGKDLNPANAAQAAMESYITAFWWAAGIFALGGVVSAVMLRHGAPTFDPDAPKVIAH